MDRSWNFIDGGDIGLTQMAPTASLLHQQPA
jgi:hypothetical protein